MSTSFVAVITGYLGQDPEIKAVNSDTLLANFSIATTTKYRKNGETVSETDWHQCVAWNGQAEVAEKFLKKGSMVQIITKRCKDNKYKPDWAEKEITTKQYIVDQIVLLDSKEKGEEGKGKYADRAGSAKGSEKSHDRKSHDDDHNPPPSSAGYDDDIPF